MSRSWPSPVPDRSSLVSKIGSTRPRAIDSPKASMPVCALDSMMSRRLALSIAPTPVMSTALTTANQSESRLRRTAGDGTQGPPGMGATTAYPPPVDPSHVVLKGRSVAQARTIGHALG